MDNPVDIFSNIIDQTFPDLDPETKENIREKILGHILVRLEEESYHSNPEGAKELHDQMNLLEDPEKSKLYGNKIGEKFSGLPEMERKAIMEKLNIEFFEIMHKIYQQSQ